MRLVRTGLCLIWACLAAGNCSEAAITYYVDNVLGADSNDGNSSEQAWRTLSKVSGGSYAAGDRILLKCGETFPGRIYFDGDSGSAGLPIEIASYGTGPKPVINAAGYLAGVYLEDSGHVIVRDLEITADGGATVDGSSADERYGVLVKVLLSSGVDSITITNLYIHDIYPEVAKTSEGANPTTYMGSGISVQGAIDFPASNIEVADCEIERTGYKAIELNRCSQINVLNNRMKDIGGPAIQSGRCADMTVRGNIVDGSGSYVDSRMHGRGSGIWPWTCDNVLIEQNAFMHARGRQDSCGMHIDSGCNDVVVQRNLSLDNAGGFIEILGNNSNCTYRYNISINDGWRVKGELDQGSISNTQDGYILFISGYVWSGYSGPFNSYIYNNTVYVKSDIRSNFSIHKTANGLLIANNIFYLEGPTEDVTPDWIDDYTSGMASRVVWHDNLYPRTGVVPVFNLNQFTDTNQIVGDPLFANIGGLTEEDYAPHAFPLILNGGVVVTNIPGDSVGLRVGLNAAVDFFGNPIVGLPDLGAVEVESRYSSLLTWLDTYGIALDADLTGDPNGDGVSLLAAYSLNLDPTQNLSGLMPQIMYNRLANTMDMSFYGQASNVDYGVMQSTNLLSGWEAFQAGQLSPPDSNGFVTAAVPVTNSIDRLFLRLRCTLL